MERFPARTMPRLALASMLLAAFVLVFPASAQDIPALLSLPPGVVAARPDLVKWRATLVKDRGDLLAHAAGHDRRCSAVVEGSKDEVPCREELSGLTHALKTHIECSDKYNDTVRKAEIAPPLAWDDEHHLERKAWSDELRKAIELNLQVLENSDIKEWAPNYDNLSKSQKIDIWASLFAAIASFEDPSYKTDAPYSETKILNTKTKTYYKPFPSIGLFQLSYKEQPAYGWNVDVKTKYLEDPLANIRCGVTVLAHLVQQDHVIAKGGDNDDPRGGARYWRVLREGHNINNIREMVKEQALAERLPLCQ